MNADQLATALIFTASPAATAIPLILVLTTKWWRTWITVALLVLSTGLALLIDISLLYAWLGDDYPGRDYVRNAVYLTVVTGVWLILIALVRQKVRDYRNQ